MLECAQCFIKADLAQKNLEVIESGQVLLAEGNSSHAEDMAKPAAINEKLQKM